MSKNGHTYNNNSAANAAGIVIVRMIIFGHQAIIKHVFELVFKFILLDNITNMCVTLMQSKTTIPGRIIGTFLIS